jgi:hypothetical protein
MNGSLRGAREGLADIIMKNGKFQNPQSRGGIRGKAER